MVKIIIEIFLKHLKPKKHKYNPGIVGTQGKSWSETVEKKTSLSMFGIYNEEEYKPADTNLID